MSDPSPKPLGRPETALPVFTSLVTATSTCRSGEAAARHVVMACEVIRRGLYRASSKVKYGLCNGGLPHRWFLSLTH
jgi:hypothetical protein